MKVKYIDPMTGHLTTGKVYDMLEEDTNFYLIKDDSGDEYWFAARRFIKLVESSELFPIF